uniref:ras-related protein Rab-24 isoform 3 n=1 Tax=Mus musculus TaxID=10090 RepID=UPI0030CC0527
MSGQRVDVKVVMLGKEYVGKTSLVERYVHDRFLVGPYQNTIGAAFVAKVMCVGDRTVTLGIWGCQIYLCGTKSDLLEEDRRRRRVDFHDVQDYADNIKAQLFETSSKTGQSVDELFQKVAEDYVSVAAFQVMTVTSPLFDRGQRCGFEPEGKPLLLQLLSSLSHHSSGPVELDEFPEGLDLTLVWAGMVKRLSYSRCLSQQRWHLPVLAHGTEEVLG